MMDQSTTLKRRVKPVLTECKICGASAIYSYFGAIVCSSCKVFFRRNAEHGRDKLKCGFDGDCEINTKTRHICASCRLMKCFRSGMQTEMFRSSRLEAIEKKKTPENRLSTSTQQLATLNLRQSDRSTLTSDQWNLISNILNCYNEHSGLAASESFINEQNLLPLKMRFKCAPLMKLYRIIFDGTQLLYTNNQDFRSLSPYDQSILLHSTFKHTSTLSTSFLTYITRLSACPAYFDTVGILSYPSVIPLAKRVPARLGFDLISIKLLLAILSVSTINYTVYSRSSPMNLSNIQQVLHIQNTYIELLWRYLLYKTDFQTTVKSISELIRCIFAIHDIIVVTCDVQWLSDTLDTLIQKTEQTLSLES